MTRPNNIPLLGLCAIAALALALWLLLADGGGDVHAPEANTPATALDTQAALDVPLSAKAEGDTGTLPLPEKTANLDQTDKRGFEETTAETEEPALVPVYGALVRRGGAIARFELLDAHDQPLFDDAFRLQLWRRLGIRWIEEEVIWDDEQRLITCDGHSAAGLEPGEYELQVDSSLYGRIVHRFRVDKDEKLDGVLRMDSWRRIVCFDFKDLNGEPVAWIHAAPFVTSQAPKLEAIERTGAPDPVLRLPPQRSAGGRGGRGGFSYRRARGDGSRQYKTATDNGRYYVPVISGVQNSVTFSLGDEWGVDSVHFEGEFLAQEWECKEVVLDLVLDFNELTADWTPLGTQDPGRRSHLQWIDGLLNPPAPDDPADVRDRRLVIELEAPRGALVKYGKQSRPEDAYSITNLMAHRGNLHYVDARAGETVWFVVESQGLPITLPEPVKLADDADNPIQRIKRVISASVMTMPDWSLPPTLDAWAVHRQLIVSLDWQSHDGPVLGSWGFDAASRTCQLPDALSLLLSGAPQPDGAHVQWRFGGSERRQILRIRPTASDRWDGGWTPELKTIQIDMINPTELAASLPAGQLTPPKPSGLILRVVGPSGEGLPWVECSIVRYEDDKRANRLRDIETALADEGTRPSLNSVFADDYYDHIDEFNEDTIDPDRMKPFVGEAFIRHTSDPGDLAYYARTGAWYNTWARVKSDAVGYIYDSDAPVFAGQKYVLYLWSNSRDDLHPDARVVFQATGDLTDIGAIQLPAYSD